MQVLPVDAVLNDVCAAVAAASRLVLTAAPGAGKSTRVPPALLGVGDGRVLVAQPRRAAARQLARRVAGERGWRLGREIGYQTRFERVGEADTPLWFVTTGIVRRRLHDDPTLEGVACVVLDEFHERTVDGDILLGWLRDLHDTGLRSDLRLVVMSATLDAARVAAFLGDAPVLAVPGSLYPVRTMHQPPRPRERLEAQVVRALRERASDLQAGTGLVFLPGVGEIRSCLRAVAEACPERAAVALHGGQSAAEQDAVLDPAAPDGRIICATNIAETSLTVPGVRWVIDAGEQRVDRFRRESGFPALVLEPCSRFQADQRRGRAGRLGPGVCVRLWSSGGEHRRREEIEPEVQRCDPVALALDLKAWWGTAVADFPWLDHPGSEACQEAEAVLRAWDLIDDEGLLNAAGRRLAALPLEPHLGRLLLAGAELDCLPLAAACAALLDGREPRGVAQARGGGDDLSWRLAALDRRGGGDEIRRIRDDLLRHLGWRGPAACGVVDGDVLRRLLLTAWPDRLGIRTGPGANRVRLPAGRVVQIDEASECHLPAGRRDADLVIALRCRHLRGRAGERTVLGWGVSCSEDDLRRLVPERLHESQTVTYDAQRGVVRARRNLSCGPLLLRVLNEEVPSPAVVGRVLFDALRPQARALAEAHPPLAACVARLAWLEARGLAVADAPVIDEAFFEALLEDACWTCGDRAAVQGCDWWGLLQARLGWPLMQALDRLAPTSVVLPNGRQAPLDYSRDPGPVLAARIQELFGCDVTPSIADGRHPVVLHLLAPNGRPQQITDDLPGFWQRTWPQVRKDLRGRYPKHAWPEDPLAHPPCGANGRPKRR